MLLAAELSDDTALDANALSAQIESFAALRAQQKKLFFQNAHDQLIKTIQQSGSAGNFVLGCMKQTRFDDVKNGNADAAKWKKDNQKLFSNHDIEKAASLQLKYLALTLERAGLDSAEPLQQKLWDYLAELYKTPELFSDSRRDPEKVKFSVYDAKQGKVVNELVGDMQQTGPRPIGDDPQTYVDEILNSPVTSHWVAQSMKLDGHFGSLSDWATSAGNFSDIVEQDIRPVLRDKKDPRLISTWDYEISFLGLVANKSRDKKNVIKFEQETYPRLVWKKAGDLEKLGLPNRALEMRIALAKNYPTHPDFESWAAEIMKNLSVLKNAAPPKTGEAGSQAMPAATLPVGSPTPGAPAL